MAKLEKTGFITVLCWNGSTKDGYSTLMNRILWLFYIRMVAQKMVNAVMVH